MRTREEAEVRIDRLESWLFMLNMKDHWNDNDWTRYYEMKKEVEELKKELEVRA